jgi:hypothetical protein
MLRRVALVRTAVPEQLSASFIKMTGIDELGTTLVTASVVPSSPILVTLMKEALSSSKTSIFTRATRRNIQEDTILNTIRNKQFKHRGIAYISLGSIRAAYPISALFRSPIKI